MEKKNRQEKAKLFLEAVEIMARLREPGGCPWDREQNLQSLKIYLIEECYEVLDAMERGTPQEHSEELGDLLLQVLFQARIREEEKVFDIWDVIETLNQKLVGRHPHVFGDMKVKDSKEVLKNWSDIKLKKEKKSSVLSGIPQQLPAMIKAFRVQQKVSGVGFDWQEIKGVVEKIDEELGELKEAMDGANRENIMDELGDLLFSVINLARFIDMDPESALLNTCQKFINRFQKLEDKVRVNGWELTDMSLEKMDEIWEEIKG